MSVTSAPHLRCGLPFEGFGKTAVSERRRARAVTQRNNMLFSNMTLNRKPLPIDTPFAALAPKRVAPR